MKSIAELMTLLTADGRRVSLGFTDDLLRANAVLHNPAATDEEMSECLALWFQYHQSCQFGKVAAKQGRIHFCFLRETELLTWTDADIAAKISEEKRLWKQRAAFDSARAAHSFVLVVCSLSVTFAAPDRHLRAFCDRLLQIADWSSNQHGARHENTVSTDYLYLRKPGDQFYGFRFNIDFFACAGDRRWWKDHRVPGGIAFTANSPGHMARFREWYEAKEAGDAWALKQAMLTIQNAAPTKETTSENPIDQGRVTWLRSLGHGEKPLIADVSCPIEKLPTMLEGSDWTRYEGLLHTDHAVREEFFLDRDTAPTASKPYLMDFTYLYNDRNPEYADFSRGKLFTEEDVYAEIGQPEDWTHRAGRADLRRSDRDTGLVAESLELCRAWAENTAPLEQD